MFKKVLIAEDFQDTSSGIVQALSVSTVAIPEIQEELYCDKAYARLKIAYRMGEPFDLLITDLYFKEDQVTAKLTSGLALIDAIHVVRPNLKIIVNSMEDNPMYIKKLFQEHAIDAYVCKGRRSLLELRQAMVAVYEGNTYLSSQIHIPVCENVFELDAFDLVILKELAKGKSKKEIAGKFKQDQIAPNSESTIDKRVSKLFDDFGATNTTQLIAILIRDGLIE